MIVMTHRPAAVAVAILSVACVGETAPLPDAAQVSSELLAADRAFAAGAASLDLVDAVGPMLASDVMSAHRGTWEPGADSLLAAMRANPANAGARLQWDPVRVGVSADGQHGFTFGYMTMRRADSSVVPLKYLTYWKRGAEGWRAAAWKRVPAPAPPSSVLSLPPHLPGAMVDPVTDSAVIRAHLESVMAAEQSFSDDAQVIGIGRAFQRWGRADAMNMGPNPEFLISAQVIGTTIADGDTSTTSPVSWSADRAIVASSGDLGVTFGIIRSNDGDGGAFPFFTVWARESPDQPWRYIAE